MCEVCCTRPILWYGLLLKLSGLYGKVALTLARLCSKTQTLTYLHQRLQTHPSPEEPPNVPHENTTGIHAAADVHAAADAQPFLGNPLFVNELRMLVEKNSKKLL